MSELSLFEELKERGFVKEITDEAEVPKLLNSAEQLSVYAGFDPTGVSLHIGHLIPIMILSHMQRAGHRPLCIVGGATALVGDPSGKDSIRKMLTEADIQTNINGIKKQLEHFINFEDEKALLLNNFDWLGRENYIEMLRKVGTHFTVNRMLTAEAFKLRMEKGLSFLEFNYMIMQAYDFYILSKKYDCKLEIGGDDQWSNILAGMDLVRRKDQKLVYGLTAPLLTKSDGKKMGKTESGSVWLNPEMTSPLEYFQYWRNTLDDDVVKFMKLYTYLPLSQIREYEKLEGADLNPIKELLAYEATKLVHGKEEADKSRQTARDLFSGNKNSAEGAPVFKFRESKIFESSVADLFIATELLATKGEVKRMAKQGGISINDKKVTDFNKMITAEDLVDGKISMQKGKKKFVFEIEI